MFFYNQRLNKDVDITFRQLASGDDEQFVTCVQDFYGDGYPYKQYLNVDYLVEQSRQNKMVVCCGETAEGEIVSTVGANFDSGFQRSCILILRVVKRAYTGMKIATEQLDYLFRMLEERDHTPWSWYADVMTHDIISQKSLVRNGYVFTGLRMMLYHNHIMVPKVTLSENSKMTQVILCVNKQVSHVGTIFCPEQHRDFVKNIYDSLGCMCDIKVRPNQPMDLSVKTDYSLSENVVHNNMCVMIFRVGADLEELLEGWMKKYAAIPKQTFLCYLNMKEEGSLEAYGRLVHHGFFFTGIKPLNENGEFMVLANVGDLLINYDEIKIHPQGIYLLEYVRNCKKNSEKGME